MKRLGGNKKRRRKAKAERKQTRVLNWSHHKKSHIR